jgi:hypothetical protein
VIKEINARLSQIQSSDHVVQKALTEKLMDSVGPVFDTPGMGEFFPLRPSGCMKPMRDLYYDLLNYYNPNTIPKEDFEPRIKLIFQFGHLTEDLLKKLCKHEHKVLFEQQRVKYGELVDKDGTIIPLSGAIDWAMKLDPLSDVLTLCDAKSIGDYPFKSVPKEDNIAQMQLYMHSDWGRANNVNNAILIYFNKNTSAIKCIEIPYDGNLATKILERLTFVWECYKKAQLPPREYIPGQDWRADYSPYKDHDNRDFTIRAEERFSISVQEYYQPQKYEKDNVRSHFEKYDDKVVYYLDKKVYLVYNNEKLELIKEKV